MKNIVLITSDAVRANHCSFMGYNRITTPNLDEMAKNGLCFENAYAPSSRTLPSMSSFFTGDLITEYINCDSMEKFGKNGRLNLKRKTTLAEALSKKGYSTGAFNPNAYASRYFGFDKGFDYFQDFLFDTGFFDRYLKGGKAMKVFRNFKNWATKKEVFKSWEDYYEDIINWVENTRKPFFLWIFLLETHFPYLPSRKYRKWSNPFDIYRINYKLYNSISKKKVEFPQKDINKAVDMYDDTLRFADAFLGRFIKDLEDYDPLIVFHSDHGEAFFERGFYGHYFPSLYEETIKVPLVVYNSNLKDRVTNSVSTLDLYPALLDFAETGEFSLSQMDRNGVMCKDIVYNNQKSLFSIRLGDWKLIAGQNGEELYNLKKDPQEQCNLINKNLNLAAEFNRIVKIHKKQEAEKKRIQKIIRT